jgi:hypothetical protein
MNEYMFLCGMDTLSWNDNQDNNSNNVIEAKSEPKKGGTKERRRATSYMSNSHMN